MDTCLEFDNINESPLRTNLGRKRKLIANTRKQVSLFKRSQGGYIPHVTCRHSSTQLCCANQLTSTDMVEMFTTFCTQSSYAEQNSFLLALMTVSNPVRARIEDTERKRARDVTVRYSVTTTLESRRLPVCKGSFMTLFNVKKDRLSRLAKDFLKDGEPRKERRGGSRQTQEMSEFKESVVDHIQSFSCRASHYARRGAPGRKYLPSDLSVAKMVRLFNEQNHQQASYALYYSIFMFQFNLSFGHPAKDVCSDCLRLKIKIRTEGDFNRRRAMAVNYLIHRRRARKFYDLMDLAQDNLTICFDVMENLVLPKTSVGQAYYSRQLYMYVFAVVKHFGRGVPVSKDNIFLYTWKESDSRKDSNVIASALEHALLAWLPGYNGRLVRLFSDSCFGQNKKFSVVSMLQALRKQKHHIDIEYTFPIRGHSFLPADRVFGRIEQEIRKRDTILMPADYISILQNHGAVQEYRKSWRVKDFKKEVASCVKTQKGFKISEARVLRLSNDKIGFKSVYEGPFCEYSILKRGFAWGGFNPVVLGDVSCVKGEKKRDVMSLLDVIGASEDVKDAYGVWLQSNYDGPENIDSSDDDDI